MKKTTEVKHRSEELVKKDLKKRFDKWGAWHFMPASNGFGKSGVGDHICCVPVHITPNMVGMKVGLFVMIEAKAEGRRGEKNRGMTPNQVSTMAEIWKAQGLGTVADCIGDLRLIEFAIGYTEEL